METKINIAAILKDKPQGTKLYDWLHNIDVEFDNVETTEIETSIWCTRDKEGYNELFGYSKLGTLRGWLNGLQILLPSKEMRDWRKFAWKKGDELVNSSGFKLFFDRWANDDYTRFFGKANLLENSFSYETEKYTLASKYETLDTLEIEKPEFKDGDIVAVDLYRKNIRIFKEKKNENNFCWGKYYIGFSFNNEGKLIQTFKNYTADCSSDRLATDSEKQQLFDALAKEGKRWDAEKKMIVDLKPKCEFKPFDRCIWKIRNCEGSIWQASFVSYVDKYGATPMGMSIDEDLVNLIILPYNDQTKLLVGTTDDWEGGEQ